MKILFLTDGLLAPGSRFRVGQFLPYFEAQGISCTLRYAYGAAYNDVLGTPWAGPYKLACRLRRAAHTLSNAGHDLVFLQRVSIPVTAGPELLRAIAGSPLIFDFDDAIYLGPGGVPSTARSRAFRTAIQISTHVIAGNRYLAAEARAPEKTTVIPTVLDTDKYVPAPQRKRDGSFVVGWMGTASNFESLRPIVPQILEALRTIPNSVFRVVSNSRMPEWDGHPRIEQVRWAEHLEVRQLQSFDVGLMPLLDTPLTWGKCGFKMIQYMAVGVPVVASAVGANVDLFAESGAGYLVPPGGDWVAPVRALAADHAARHDVGKAGRAHAVRNLSIPAAAKTLVRIFEQAKNARNAGPHLTSRGSPTRAPERGQ